LIEPYQSLILTTITAMQTTNSYRGRDLFHGQITYSIAQTEENDNILQQLTYVELAAEFRLRLDQSRDQIAALVANLYGGQIAK
jgi:hypothetical protein